MISRMPRRLMEETTTWGTEGDGWYSAGRKRNWKIGELEISKSRLQDLKLDVVGDGQS